MCLEQFVAVQFWAASALLLDGFQRCVWFGFLFRRRRSALDDPDSISINLGFIFRALLHCSRIMELADFLERALVVLSALGNVFTLEWTYAVVNSYRMPIWSRLGLSARSFFGYLEVAPASVVRLKLRAKCSREGVSYLAVSEWLHFWGCVADVFICLRHSCKSGIVSISSSKVDSTRCWVFVFLWCAAVGILEVRSLQVGSAQCMLTESLSAKLVRRRPCVVLRAPRCECFSMDNDCVVPSVALGRESARARTGNAAASVVSLSFLNADVPELVVRSVQVVLGSRSVQRCCTQRLVVVQECPFTRPRLLFGLSGRHWMQ